MHIIFGNYGDNTMALIQFAAQAGLAEVVVLHVETGWAAQGWHERVLQAQDFVRQCGFQAVTLHPPTSFPDQILDRGQFPSVKFQWCAGFLKGLAFINWAQQHDPTSDALVLLPSRRCDSRLRFELPEFVDDVEHYGGRRVWYPLYDVEDHERDRLAEATGMTLLHGRSLECQPCIHSSLDELNSMASSDVNKVKRLENAIQATFSSNPTHQGEAPPFERFDMGCGGKYVCGE